VSVTARGATIIMMTGPLEIKGEIDLGQFWPRGEPDGDTVHVTLAQDAFRFRASPGHSTMTTHGFDHAIGASKKPLIHNGRVTIRLQGIDAPELHYSTQLKRTENFRQYQGETSAMELAQGLRGTGTSTILPCRVVTAVDHPNDGRRLWALCRRHPY